jgi:hypothetical protein
MKNVSNNDGGNSKIITSLLIRWYFILYSGVDPFLVVRAHMSI